MKFQRVLMTLLAAMLLPALAFAQTDQLANFTVQKTFDDGNDETPVTISIQCFTGIPLNQSVTVQPDNKNGNFEVKFVVDSFTQGELDCNIWEEDVTGYSAIYKAKIEEGTDGSKSDGTAQTIDPSRSGFGNGPCSFEDLGSDSGLVDASCTIRNYPAPVAVSVAKDWVIDTNMNPGDVLDPQYKLVLKCDSEIVDGTTQNNGNWRKTLYNGVSNGVADKSYSADVVPYWDGGTSCWVDETVYDSAVEVSSTCGNNKNPGMLVEIASGDSCTVTNTLFFEGIPTLSQYGMAIMALLMLGLGFVGFRRFV